MLKRLAYRLLERRHYWRYTGFNELSELYTSMMLRSLGLSLIGIFVPIYLYLTGYSLMTVFLFMAGLFAIRSLANFVSGFVVAKIGPKHAILASNVFQILFLILLLTLPQNDWPLWWIAAAWAFSLSMFFVAYHVDFSKVIHSEHGGKELGIMTIVERIGAALGPLVGGVIATFYGPEYTIAAATVLFILAAMPLLLSPEPTRTNQKITFRGISWYRYWHDLASYAALAYDNTVSIAVWPLFMGVAIFASNTYASVGLATSIGIAMAILTAHSIGKIIDHSKGRNLLRLSVWVNAALHLVRPFISTMGGAILVNGVNEAVSTAYRLPYVKGMYDRADSLPGYRIAYIVVLEFTGDLGKTAAWLMLAGLALVFSASTAMMAVFVITGVISLLIMLERFPALTARRI